MPNSGGEERGDSPYVDHRWQPPVKSGAGYITMYRESTSHATTPLAAIKLQDILEGL